MEKYDYIVKSSEIRKLVEKRMYQNALQIMETMDINKIKVLPDLSIFAEVYMQTEHYDEAERILLRLRDKSGSRRIIYQLIKLAIKRKNSEDAEYYYNEFVEAAPRDADQYILRYRIDKMEKKDYPVLIASLKELKKYDYNEKWAYELAKVYHKAGMVEQCIAECSDLILWFGEGVVVEKAKMLKEHYLGSESDISENVVFIDSESKFDFLEQEDVEPLKEQIKEEETVQMEEVIEEAIATEETVEADEIAAIDETATIEEVTETVEPTQMLEEPVQDNVQEHQFHTKDISDISQMLENYFEEEKQAMEQEVSSSNETKKDTVEEQISLDSYNELFGRFYSIASIRLQVVNLVNDMLKQQNPYSFAIAGTAKCGKTTLAKCLIKLLVELQVFPYKKVAKISSERLNEINLEEHYERLQKGYLIVEEAGGLQPENQLQLIKMLRDLRGNIVVVLEDTEGNLQTLFRTYPMLSSYIKDIITIQAFGKTELYDYAADFFREREFELEEDADIMLQLICDELEGKELAEDRPTKLLKKLNETIENLERRGLQEVACEKSAKNLDDSNINIIYASDFGDE